MTGELISEEVDGLLRRAFVGRIALEADGGTHVVPVNFAYDGVAVYARLEEGTKLRMLRRNRLPALCIHILIKAGQYHRTVFKIGNCFQQFPGRRNSTRRPCGNNGT